MEDGRSCRFGVPRLFLVVGALLIASRGTAQTQFGEARLLPPRPVTAEAAPTVARLPDLIRLSLERHPGLQQAVVEVDAAQGRAAQAGLYPNPTVSVIADELGDRQGRAGILTIPQVTQEIVTGGKLTLSRAVALRDVDLATLAVVRQRYMLLTAVRQAYFEALAAQRRVEILEELVRLAAETYEGTGRLLKATQVAKLDLLQIEVELERVRGELEAARRERRAAFGRLTAGVGVPDLPDTRLAGPLEAALPEYEFERARALVHDAHPEVRSAQVGVSRAQLALQRAQAEPIPNVTVGAGYVRQNQNKSNDWMLQVSVPVPLFNRNQGAVAAAQAELGRANLEVARVRNDLTNRLWSAFGQYGAARQRAERYRRAILPKARQAFDMVQTGFKGGQFDGLRVLQAQRAVQEANLEYVRALAEAWRAASEIAGLLQEEYWPQPRTELGEVK